MNVNFSHISFQLLMGVTRLGFMASFMSDPFISGFTTGAAVHVFSSQIKHIFGVHVNNHYGPLALVHVSIYLSISLIGRSQQLSF